MATEVAICNKALIQDGAKTIISLDDDTTEAILCKALYADLRDAVLEAHDWTFAIERLELPKGVPDPTFRYTNRYPLPSTTLHVLEVNKIKASDDTRDWRLESNAILINESVCKVKIIKQVTDTSKFSPLFIQALAARLAADMAIPLTQNINLETTKYQLYLAKLKEAAARDNQQGKSQRIRSRFMERARLSSGPKAAGPVV
jgi:hypothetical protein